MQRPVQLVGAGSDGLPTGTGAVLGARGWVVQLAGPLPATVGAPVTLRLPDGQVLRWTVVSRSAPGPRDAAARSAGPLTVLVPAADGRWVVVTAR